MSFLKNIHLQYYVYWIKSLPDLPLMYLQGKETRNRIPDLPDATDVHGSITKDGKCGVSVLFLGESTVAGVGAESHRTGFAGSMSESLSHSLKCDVTYEVIAKSGWTAKDLYKRLNDWKPYSQYDLIVIGLGGNDSFQFTSPSKWQSSIINLIDTIQSKYPKSPIVFCNMPPTYDFIAFPPVLQKRIGGMTEILRLALAQTVMDLKNVYFNDERISLLAWSERHDLEPNPSLYFSDGVHPSTLTYQIWGKEMVEFITRLKIII
ncbi:MAG: SGNH/GDSL hydrolase family protein [Saprospiraceae bacterium]|nr:SGNH/GDSL hydrolase family protein [Saprospiraceae bacterium]